jgi:alkylation response protein AidB-like acyl-CoA dehydrogenase
MKIELTPDQSKSKSEFSHFVVERIIPYADAFDDQKMFPSSVISSLGGRRYLGVNIAPELGGLGLDPIVSGLLFEQMGRASCALMSLFAVHGMVAHAISNWSSDSQKKKWLPKLARGEAVAAFALTEPDAGTDASAIQSKIEKINGAWSLNGSKKWISFGMRADVFLVLARLDGRVVGLLVDRNLPGLSISPAPDMLSFRSAQLASLSFQNCCIPDENIIGHGGFGFSNIMNSCLNYGRYCVAWGSVGLAQACLEASVSYASQRVQFGKLLKEHDLIREMLSDMLTNVKAARLLCYQAGYSRQMMKRAATSETAIAKYFASRAAAKAAADAVQIHGANGLSREYPVQRYFRDAKALELIEGSSQVHQMIIAKFADFTNA